MRHQRARERIRLVAGVGLEPHDAVVGLLGQGLGGVDAVPSLPAVAVWGVGEAVGDGLAVGADEGDGVAGGIVAGEPGEFVGLRGQEGGGCAGCAAGYGVGYFRGEAEGGGDGGEEEGEEEPGRHEEG